MTHYVWLTTPCMPLNFYKITGRSAEPADLIFFILILLSTVLSFPVCLLDLQLCCLLLLHSLLVITFTLLHSLLTFNFINNLYQHKQNAVHQHRRSLVLGRFGPRYAHRG
jgi:hypothetical protein